MLAGHAGFLPRESQLIAYASQYVDDAVAHEPMALDRDPGVDFFYDEKEWERAALRPKGGLLDLMGDALGIDPEDFRPGVNAEAMKKELGISPKARVVGMMGRLGPVKGHDFLQKAAKKVLAAVPDAIFVVIYPDVEACDKFLPALERSRLRDRFILVGLRERPADAAQLAEVAVIPSVGSEAHCRVALEWMSLSVPVIGSRVGVIPEIVEHGKTGFLIQPRYSETIAHCIIKLLTHPGQASDMGRAGRERLVDFFSEDRMVEENLEVFFQAADERN